MRYLRIRASRITCLSKDGAGRLYYLIGMNYAPAIESEAADTALQSSAVTKPSTIRRMFRAMPTARGTSKPGRACACV